MSTKPGQSAVPSDKLSTLPVELTTEILSYLPATSIALCQRVSRRFGNIICNPRNRFAIHTRSLDTSFARLQDSAIALFRVSHGWPQYPHPGIARLLPPSWSRNRWIKNALGMHPPLLGFGIGEKNPGTPCRHDEHVLRIARVKQIVCAIGDALVQSRGDNTDRPLNLADDFIATIKDHAMEPWMEDEAAVMELYEKVITPDGLFSDARVHDHDDDTDPLWLATYLDQRKGGATYRQRMLFVSTAPHFCYSYVLASALDVPQFPTHQDFAYATTSGWTHHKLKEWVEQGEMAFLTILEKAAVLEDLRFASTKESRHQICPCRWPMLLPWYV